MPFSVVFLFLSFINLINFSRTFIISEEENWTVYSEKIDWCTATIAEQQKCVDLRNALLFASVQKTVALPPILECVFRPGKYECMRAIENGQADVMAVEAGDMFTAGRWYGLVPIAVEEYGGASVKNSVVLIRKSSQISSVKELRNKQLCSPGVGSLAGWILPVSKLLRLSNEFQTLMNSPEENFLNITDCNNVIKTMSSFFGPSCVPGILDVRYNQRSNNPDDLCQKCGPHSDTTEWCTSADPYAGTDGVLNCMVHGVGEVGFMSAEVALKLPLQIRAQFEFLCSDGSTAALTELSVCSWGIVPADVFITDSSKNKAEKVFLQKFLLNLTRTAQRMFSDRLPVTGEKRYTGSDLMWSDAMTSIRILPESEQRYQRLLGTQLHETAQGDTSCPYVTMRLCVVGREELNKCLAFQMALQSQNLKPLLLCILARNHWDCMQRISSNQADVAVVDAADSYLAEKLYGLIPFMAELYDQTEPFFYAVAVAKRRDLMTTLLDLRGRRTCHGAIYSATGWSVPISFLVTQNRVRQAFDCQDLTYQVSQIFQKACAPGALVAAHDRSVLHAENLCDLCMGDIDNYCSRGPGEPYYGSAGAFKCLAEGGGHVAFVMHRTVWENTDGRNMRTWARALVSQDYELLCVDGTRTTVQDFLTCNLGRVPANVVMTSRVKSEGEIAAFMSLLEYAQELFGSPSSGDFQMFQSDGYASQDLIFRDSTMRLIGLPVENRSVEAYLGEDFIRIISRAQCSHATVVTGGNFFLLFAISVFVTVFS